MMSPPPTSPGIRVPCWTSQQDQPSFSGFSGDSENPHLEMDPPFPSNILLSHASNSPTLTSTSKPKSSAELMKEIATLEVQILQLESYLLSLYRTAFQHHVPISKRDHGAQIKDNNISRLQITNFPPYYEQDSARSPSDFSNLNRFFHSRSLPCSYDQTKDDSKLSSGRADDEARADTRHRSLADHFGSSQMAYALDNPSKLSEEIVRCMCCIYCKFATPAVPQKGFSISSDSSLSSSSTFSPKNISGSWSPQFSEETKGCFEGLREDTTTPYAYGAAIEVVKICLDDDSFKYAATMLQKLRSLVENLEHVDPRKMKREEKLAFWLNIHNALAMHGYLAYGTDKFARSCSILKAAYNVGGHCINAHIIQSSILGIRSHYSAPWLQTLLSPKKKATKHIYSLEYPEPLVHFALCSGSCSDPLVRVYTANNVFQDLKVARDEFIRATVYIQKDHNNKKEETKLYLPKVMSHFGREMSVKVNELLETVCSCVPELQQKAIRACIQGGECVCWIPQSSTFRFLIRKEDVLYY